MSRIGQNPVEVPEGVEIRVDGQKIFAKGKHGEQSLTIHKEIEVGFGDGKVALKPRSQSKIARNMWGTSRSLVDSLITGVSEGFIYNLEINGVGYRAAVQGNKLQLQLGYSHEVVYPIPDGITIKCARPTHIEVSGSDKQRVGQVAAEIRRYRPPEPYKGKGVKYENEYILRKEGKKK